MISIRNRHRNDSNGRSERQRLASAERHLTRSCHGNPSLRHIFRSLVEGAVGLAAVSVSLRWVLVDVWITIYR